MDTIARLLTEKVAHAWRLWTRGLARENYSRVDEPGVVLVLEVENADAAMRLLADGLPVARPALSWHLRVLKDAGLLIDEADSTPPRLPVDPRGIHAMKS
jgi:DNA-binding transcriptional ArsR family regulator